MAEGREAVGLVSVLDFYIEKISMDALDLSASVATEIEVMHIVNGEAEECWAAVLKSSLHITQFIDLFCKKSPRKVSVFALAAIDKLQSAYNHFLEAARSKQYELKSRISTTAGEYMQQSAKFFTYALIAERSNKAILSTMCSLAGDCLAQAATQRHRSCEIFVESGGQLYNVSFFYNMAESSRSRGETRQSSIYTQLAEHHKLLAAVAVINFITDDLQSSIIWLQSPEMKRIYSKFETQLCKIASFCLEGKLWQAEVLLCDLSAHVALFDNTASVEDDIATKFDALNMAVDSPATVGPEQQDYLNRFMIAVPAVQLLSFLRHERSYLHYYVQFLQV